MSNVGIVSIVILLVFTASIGAGIDLSTSTLWDAESATVTFDVVGSSLSDEPLSGPSTNHSGPDFDLAPPKELAGLNRTVTNETTLNETGANESAINDSDGIVDISAIGGPINGSSPEPILTPANGSGSVPANGAGDEPPARIDPSNMTAPPANETTPSDGTDTGVESPPDDEHDGVDAGVGEPTDNSTAEPETEPTASTPSGTAVDATDSAGGEPGTMVDGDHSSTTLTETSDRSTSESENDQTITAPAESTSPSDPTSSPTDEWTTDDSSETSIDGSSPGETSADDPENPNDIDGGPSSTDGTDRIVVSENTPSEDEAQTAN